MRRVAASVALRSTATLASTSHRLTVTGSAPVKYIHPELFGSIPNVTSAHTHNLPPLFVQFGSAALCRSARCCRGGVFIQCGAKRRSYLSCHILPPHFHPPPQSGLPRSSIPIPFTLQIVIDYSLNFLTLDSTSFAAT